MSTNTFSKDLPIDERIPFLSKYMTFKSPLEAAEFHVEFKDNSRGMVPGPSDWDIRAALKVSPDVVHQWTATFNPSESEDLSWGYALLTDAPHWQITSRPITYSRGRHTVAVFETDGIVLVRYIEY